MSALQEEDDWWRQGRHREEQRCPRACLLCAEPLLSQLVALQAVQRVVAGDGHCSNALGNETASQGPGAQAVLRRPVRNRLLAGGSAPLQHGWLGPLCRRHAAAARQHPGPRPPDNGNLS